MRYEELTARLSSADKALLDAALVQDAMSTPWRPMLDVDEPARPTPQRQAYDSPADFLLYGGAAGGGKSDLLIGLALTAHKRSLILRRESKQLAALVDRITTIRRNRDGFNGQAMRWTLGPDRIIDLGGVKDAGDEQSYQGQPHDFIGFDEGAQFLEFMFRFIVGWNRSTDPTQRCRVVVASNPPTTAEGEWLKRFWAPWLDDQHPNPAAPGELRYFVMTEAGDLEVDGPEPIELDGELLVPRSRTFIPSSVDDNPFLATTGYKATLQALPEPLRSRMLRGDFLAGREDDPWQVIPTAWVKAAQERWRAAPKPKTPMDAMGVDPSRGGRDEMVLATRYGDWYAELLARPGMEVPDGATGAAFVVTHLRDGAAAHVDVIGIGTSVYDHLKGNDINVVAIQSAEASHARDATGQLGFANKRSELWWRMREVLDPGSTDEICLPPDSRLLADLCAPKWRLTVKGVQVESKPDIVKRLGRSPDRGDAVVYALPDTPKRAANASRPTRQNSQYNTHRWRS